MKFLVEGCLSYDLAGVLAEAGHDVDWVGDWPVDPGDEEVLARGVAQGRTLITTDRGFGALAVVHRRRHVGILVIRRTPAEEHVAVCLRAIARHAEDLRTGAIVVATTKRMRVRWLKPSA